MVYGAKPHISPNRVSAVARLKLVVQKQKRCFRTFFVVCNLLIKVD